MDAGTIPVVGDGRREAELVTSLARVRRRLVDAALAAGRAPSDVSLIAVTKTFPASDLRTLLNLGVNDVGESRDQEARAKLAELGERGLATARLHFIGQLQTNKARSVARYADLVHSIDRPELAQALSHGAQLAGRDIGVFVQVSLEQDPQLGRGGVRPDELLALADQVVGLPRLSLRGLMAVAPNGGDAAEAFGRLRRLSDVLRDVHPGADAISAGMSQDLEAAVQHGATHVRIGSALLGHRSAPIG